MTNMIPMKQLKNGDVLIDNFSLLLAEPFLTNPPHKIDYEILKQAATLLESIILYERLIVDPLLPNIQMDGVSDHYTKVKRVIDTLPSGIINYLDFSLPQKLILLDSVKTTFPDLGFNWEWFLKKFDYGQDESIEKREHKESIERFLIAIGMQASRIDSKEIPYELHYFRNSGDIAKHVYYTTLSSFIGIPYIPNYHRALLYKAMLTAHNNPEFAQKILAENFFSGKPDITAAQAAILQYFEQNVIKPTDKLINSVLPWQGITSPMPPLLSRILTVSKKKNCTILDATLSLRASAEATAFRKWCAEITEAYETSDRKSLFKLLRGFISECDRWSKDLGADRPGGQISLNFFGIGIQTEIPEPITSIQRRFTKHLVFLRDLV